MNRRVLLIVYMMMLLLTFIGSEIQWVHAVDFSLIHDESLRRSIHQAWKRDLPKGESMCCLPPRYSMITTSSLTKKNSTHDHHQHISTTNSQTWIDRETMRKRIDSVSINPNGEAINSSLYYFRLGVNDYEYHVVRGRCSCRIMKQKLDWTNLCYPLNSNSFGKKHGEFEATHTSSRNYSQWTTKPTQPESFCFPLSIELKLPQVNLSQNVYIPSTIVDSAMFRLPPICPIYENCK